MCMTESATVADSCWGFQSTDPLGMSIDSYIAKWAVGTIEVDRTLNDAIYGEGSSPANILDGKVLS